MLKLMCQPDWVGHRTFRYLVVILKVCEGVLEFESVDCRKQIPLPSVGEPHPLTEGLNNQKIQVSLKETPLEAPGKNLLPNSFKLVAEFSSLQLYVWGLLFPCWMLGRSCFQCTDYLYSSVCDPLPPPLKPAMTDQVTFMLKTLPPPSPSASFTFWIPLPDFYDRLFFCLPFYNFWSLDDYTQLTWIIQDNLCFLNSVNV